ncbi:RadC family protein [Oceanicola sp. 502str15]|uniref:JAB domain-containing protein n=1 Tax=Oceanicola sp. 502str15 TaxID=2696061 RepID=UPI002094DEBF|nr:DNA repair protein RadC [Oceanicola sp. 502str15]
MDDDDPPPTQPCGFSEAEVATIDAARTILREHARSTAALHSWPLLTDYLALNAICERAEVFRVLLLDRKNRLIQDKIMGRGSLVHVPVYVSEVVRAALVFDASALILCHNHPSGDPHPSDADIELTRKILEACKLMEIAVHDHLIVGFGREKAAFSMRSAGMLDN